MRSMFIDKRTQEKYLRAIPFDFKTANEVMM